jgi:hypothetical protein
MANTKISDLHGSRKIARSGLGEIRKPALGDGTAKPGDAVGILDATGKVVRADLGAQELFVGFLDDDPSIAEDTAIPDGNPCSVIVPQSGHVYATKMEDPGGALASGQPLGLSNDAGAFEDVANMTTAQAGLEEAMGNGDTVGLLRWY